MRKPGGKRNNGWGSKAGFAGAMVLKHHYGHRFSTYDSYRRRWNKFADFLKDCGIRDTREVLIETVEDYAELMGELVASGERKISYAANLLSTVNVVLRLLREDESLDLSPEKYVGRRSRFRTEPPKGMSKARVFAAAQEMRNRGHVAEASVIEHAREFGMRKKEACLFDATEGPVLKNGSTAIIITKGTKGGRGKQIPRVILVSEEGHQVLIRAQKAQGENNNLIPKESSLDKKALYRFINSINNKWVAVRDEYDLGTIQDLRCCFACDLYESIAGFPPPILADGKLLAEPAKHEEALSTVGEQLGHGREEVTYAYIGKGKRYET